MTPAEIEIEVNGRTVTVPPDTTVASLLQQLGVDPRGAAVLRGDEVVDRADLTSTTVEAGEHLEVVRMVGGG